jgi:hypothetical protein
MRKISLSLMIAAMLLTGCESSEQLNGMFMGGTLGSIFGSSIGGLMDGPRGADAGRALGMLIGGAAGAAVTAPKNNNSSDVSSRYDNYDQNDEVDTYNRHSRRNQVQQPVTSVPEEYSNLQIENLRFVDQNNNHTLDASERAQLVFEIRNSGNQTVYNVTPVVNSSDAKHILISPTARIDAIAPGRAVRYTAELFGKSHLRLGSADFTISFAVGKLLYTVRKFQLSTANNNV